MHKKHLVILIMALIVSLVLFIVCFAAVGGLSIRADAGCTVDFKKDLTFQHPLILDPEDNDFISPNIRNGIQFRAGQKVRLACPGQSNRLSVTNVKEVEAECVSGTTFAVHDGHTGPRAFKELRCVDYPDPSARRTGRKCAGQHAEIEIGFSLAASFVPVITICFDDKKKDALYSGYKLSSRIGDQQSSVPRPDDFIIGDFYPNMSPRPSTLYTRKGQRTGIATILGSAELANKYVSLTSDFFLSRGHLTAKADFVYGSQQRATFYYVNVAPQWHTFNKNNWNTLEINTRNFAAKHKADLTVYTGVYGSASLADVHGVQRNLSLFARNDGSRAITVPEAFWKVMHDPVAKTAIAFVGHNNPYANDVASRTLCTDICNKIDWLTWTPNNITMGYSYCCDYQELKKVVDHMPELTVHGLLL